MTNMNNPFDPNFGKVPKIYLGRQKIVEDIVQSDANMMSFKICMIINI